MKDFARDQRNQTVYVSSHLANKLMGNDPRVQGGNALWIESDVERRTKRELDRILLGMLERGKRFFVLKWESGFEGFAAEKLHELQSRYSDLRVWILAPARYKWNKNVRIEQMEQWADWMPYVLDSHEKGGGTLTVDEIVTMSSEIVYLCPDRLFARQELVIAARERNVPVHNPYRVISEWSVPTALRRALASFIQDAALRGMLSTREDIVDSVGADSDLEEMWNAFTRLQIIDRRIWNKLERGAEE